MIRAVGSSTSTAVVLTAMFVLLVLLCRTFASETVALLQGNDGRAIPVPSAAQLRYQSTDFVALIHFNMATYARDGDPGCDTTNWNKKAANATGPTSDRNTFRPTSLNTTQWFDSINALGAKIAVLTAKHGCGFLLWPSNATIPLSSTSRRTTIHDHPSSSIAPYGFHTDFDLLQDFVDSAKASGVGYGFYYSIMKNFFLCRSFEGTNSCEEAVFKHQHNVTDEEYHTIVQTHLTELWTNYGDLTEIWIDSKLQGFGGMLDRLQPLAGGTPSNPRQWCGTESGYPSRDVGSGPIWQTGYGFFGNSSSLRWVDKFCDPQLFRDHIWFFEPNREIKSLKEMIHIYHDIVGRGMVMELAFAINREGLVEDSHEIMYGRLGKWVQNCYGTPVLSKQNIFGERIVALALSNYDGISFDRIVLQEDIAVGQRIRNYNINLVQTDAEGEESIISTLVSNGTSVGRKRIHLLQLQHYQYQYPNLTIVLNITDDIDPPHLALFGLYKPCYPEAGAKVDSQATS